MSPRQKITTAFRASTLRSQISLMAAVGVFLLALFSSLVTSWQSSREVRENRQSQGERLAESLAGQARLALLFDSGENARDAVAAALAFPDVVSVEIAHVNGKIVAVPGIDVTGTTNFAERARPANISGLTKAALEGEDARTWRFVAPVRTERSESPFEVEQKSPQNLGYVRVIMSKASLDRAIFSLFCWNMAISLCVAAVVVFLVRRLTRTITQPLLQLAEAMGRAEAGELEVRADLMGPRDVVNMAHAFNSMMAVLDEREEALRQAHEDALRLAHLKSEFAATMSHELRTPLNGMVGTLDMMRSSALPPTARRYVDLAWDSSQYLLELINNILDFSSLEAGKMALVASDFDVAQLCEQTIDLVAPQVSRKGLDIAYTLAPDVPRRLKGDSRRLRQVLLNLVGNAVKFTEKGEVAVNVSLVASAGDNHPTNTPDGTNLYRFAVVDSGIGVPASAIGSIFDSFTQADPSSTRGHDGSGLGLAICKQLIVLMGGQIGVESTIGAGSTFWFTLPLEEGVVEPTNLVSGASDCRVLVVDESRVVRQFLEQSLLSCGYSCGAASNLRDAAAVLQMAMSDGEPYCLLIVDMLLAASDLATLQAIRTGSLYGQPRTVLMNRYGTENEPDVPLADAYLAKPLRLERLRACVESVVGRRVASGAPIPAVTERAPRILVVEDNATSQAIASGMLEMLGCRPKIAANGRLALRASQEDRWDLILMDCNMPVMDGFEATLAIRAAEADDQHVPIVAMTANTQASDVAHCLAAGMDDHLPKPLTLSALAARLQHWLPGFVIALPEERSVEADSTDALPADVEEGGAVIDIAALQHLREAMGGGLGPVIRPFLDDMPGYLQKLDAAAKAGDIETVRRVAHAVRGASGNLGAQRLSALARGIEQTATGPWDSAEEKLRSDTLTATVPLLSGEYLQVLPLLRKELERDGADAMAPAMADAPRVLVVDDDRSTRSALRVALQSNGFIVNEVADGSEVAAEVERECPDVILMDALMPVMDGFAACARLQETPQGQAIPVLMITALDDKASIERAFAVGASDYISKPLHLAVVNQRVRRLVEATRAERHVHQLAYNDLLTGLPNRTLFNEHLNRCIERAKPLGKSLALLYLDLDRFKYVNDTLSHEIGDKLLKTASERLRACVRSTDCIARLGGDEFGIVIDDLPYVNVASATAQKICSAIMSPFEIDGHEIVLSTSVGISVFPGDGDNASVLLRRADTAMYRAKHRRSGFQFFEETMEAAASERLNLEGSLRRALENEEFAVYFQPIANAFDQRVVGMEALVRWVHPERGVVSPADFIPLAEETGLIIPIGEWVLRTACRQLKAWHDEGHEGLYVTVNLSGLQLQEPSFIETLRNALADSGLDPRYLTLEITESMLMEHVEVTLLMLDTLKATGVSLAIDDFGTGYSSLSYLRRFPVDVLKIDQSFTRDMTRNEDDAAIVAGIIALAHNLRLRVVAEGVETENQRVHLLGLKCNHIQGYLLSPPLAAGNFKTRFLIISEPVAAISEP